MDQIFFMGIESRRTKDEIGLEPRKSLKDILDEVRSPLRRRCLPWLQRNVEDATWVLGISLLSVLFTTTGSRVENCVVLLACLVAVTVGVAGAVGHLVVVEVDRDKEDVFAVFEVEPWLVAVHGDFECGKRRAVVGDSELLRLHQSLYDFLGAVAVMHVKIDYGYLFYLFSVSVHCVGSCHRHVIYEAEAIRTGF